MRQRQDLDQVRHCGALDPDGGNASIRINLCTLPRLIRALPARSPAHPRRRPLFVAAWIGDTEGRLLGVPA